jgi:hypothetical protein
VTAPLWEARRTPAALASVGEAYARVHAVDREGWDRPAPSLRSDDMIEQWTSWAEKVARRVGSAALGPARTGIREGGVWSSAPRRPVALRRYALCHNRVTPDNVIVRAGGGPLCLIDLERVKFGSHLQELAKIRNGVRSGDETRVGRAPRALPPRMLGAERSHPEADPRAWPWHLALADFERAHGALSKWVAHVCAYSVILAKEKSAADRERLFGLEAYSRRAAPPDNEARLLPVARPAGAPRSRPTDMRTRNRRSPVGSPPRLPALRRGVHVYVMRDLPRSSRRAGRRSPDRPFRDTRWLRRCSTRALRPGVRYRSLGAGPRGRAEKVVSTLSGLPGRYRLAADCRALGSRLRSPGSSAGVVSCLSPRIPCPPADESDLGVPRPRSGFPRRGFARSTGTTCRPWRARVRP